MRGWPAGAGSCGGGSGTNINAMRAPCISAEPAPPRRKRSIVSDGLAIECRSLTSSKTCNQRSISDFEEGRLIHSLQSNGEPVDAAIGACQQRLTTRRRDEREDRVAGIRWFVIEIEAGHVAVENAAAVDRDHDM